MDPACCRDGPGTEALRGRAVSEKAGWGGGACRNRWRAQPPALLTECALLTLLDQVGGGPGVAVGLGGVSGRGRGRREGLEAQAETWVGAAGLRLVAPGLEDSLWAPGRPKAPSESSAGTGALHPHRTAVTAVVAVIAVRSGLAAASAAKALQSCRTLCDLTDSSPLGSALPGILQARTLEWVAIAFSEIRTYGDYNQHCVIVR